MEGGTTTTAAATDTHTRTLTQGDEQRAWQESGKSGQKPGDEHIISQRTHHIPKEQCCPGWARKGWTRRGDSSLPVDQLVCRERPNALKGKPFQPAATVFIAWR